jgi:hypothetical protein
MMKTFNWVEMSIHPIWELPPSPASYPRRRERHRRKALIYPRILK